MISRGRVSVAVSFVAALVACGGKLAPTYRDAPTPDVSTPRFPPAPPGKLESIPTDLDDPIAQAICRDVATFRTSGTFTADSWFAVSDATSVSATLDEYRSADSPDGTTGLTLTFHLPTERGDDPTHGAYVNDRAHVWRVMLGGKFPELAPGNYYDQTVRRAEQRSLCYADALGASADDSTSAEIDGARIVITSHSPTSIAGTIRSHDGSYTLTFDAPVQIAGYPKEGPICCFGGPPSAVSKVAPACVSKPAGTFTADPWFAFAPSTELEAFIDERYLSDHPGAFLRLEFRGPPTANRDPYGEARHRPRTTITAPIDAPYPAVPAGTYPTSPSKNDETEVCYPNGLGYWDAPVNAPLGDGTLTISSHTTKEIAGVLDVGGRKIEFRSPITPTPEDVVTRPNCCRE